MKGMHCARFKLLLAWASTMLAGCGGRATVEEPSATADASDGTPTGQDASGTTDGSTPTPEGSVVDAHPDATPISDAGPEATPITDAGPTEFCSGNAKALWQGQYVEPVPVTSGLIVMDCCDGFTVRWHTSDVFGFDAVFAWQSMALLSPGTFDLAVDAGGLASVSKAGDYFVDGQYLEGSVTILQPGGPDAPSHLTVCATVHHPGDPLDGLSLYVPDVPLVSWAQQQDWTVSLLSDPTISAVKASTMPLDSLPLGPSLVGLWQVAYYDANEYKIVWDTWGSTSMIVNLVPSVGVDGVPFVVSVKGEPIFLGAFMTVFSSMTFEGPTVTVETVKEEELVFEPGYPGGPPPNPDPRNDPRILEVFAESGKLTP